MIEEEKMFSSPSLDPTFNILFASSEKVVQGRPPPRFRVVYVRSHNFMVSIICRGFLVPKEGNYNQNGR